MLPCLPCPLSALQAPAWLADGGAASTCPPASVCPPADLSGDKRVARPPLPASMPLGCTQLGLRLGEQLQLMHST